MASNDPDEGVTQQRIQFLDSTIVSPARSKEMGLADPNVKGPMVAERISADIDDEEKARRIADEDLNKKRKQKYSGFVLLWLAWQSVGVIYGDIGTSPLYVYSSTFSSQPKLDDLVGALSIIVWSLTMIVTIKYTFIVLRADDDGQGGTFALYSLLARYVNIVKHDPNASNMGVRMQRYLTDDLKRGSLSLRSAIEGSTAARLGLRVMGVLGVSLIMADGVLTPAQSVLGAVQGLRVANPDISTPTIIGVSCAILIALFLVQPFGTSRLGTSFAPIVTVWLLFNLCSGIHNLVKFDYSVLKAFSPHYAFAYLSRNGHEGWRSLGGILLAFTGVEALFADLGAFSRRAVQISWLGLAYPCLLVTYAGQAAFISADEKQTAFTNPFFFTVPPGTFIFSMVIAVLAAIVASQAMITSTFQLLTQVMRMSYFPHIKVVHTSRRFHEQIYMPLANWLLMIGTVVVTAVYNNTTSLGNAYGVCVIFVTFITTCMVSLVAILIWRLPSWVVLPVFLVFGSLDGVYLTAVLTKVPEGAWFTLLLAFILSSIFIIWRFGKEAQWAAESLDRIPASVLLTSSLSSSSSSSPAENDDNHPSSAAVATGSSSDAAAETARPHSTLRFRDVWGGTPATTVPGLGIFFDKVGDVSVLPVAFAQFLRKFSARPRVLVFFHMRLLPVPSVPLSERYVVTRVTTHAADGSQAAATDRPRLDNCYAVVLRHGYVDDVVHPRMGADLVAQIEAAITRSSSNNSTAATANSEGPSASFPLANAQELATLRVACSEQTVYVLGKEAMRIREAGPPGKGTGNQRASIGTRIAGWPRRLVLAMFLWIRENSRTKLADLDIDVDKLVEVGFVKEI